MEFHENWGFSWKSYFFWNSLIFWIPQPFTKPLYSLLKIKVWASSTPKNLKNHEIPSFSPKSPKFHHFPQNSWNFRKNTQKQFLEDSGGSLAAPCWKPWYSYRNIEVFKPPGRTRNAPKHKKWRKSPQNMKVAQKSWKFMKFHEMSWNSMKTTISDQFWAFWGLRNLDSA